MAQTSEMGQTFTKTVTIKNRQGLHNRPSVLLVQLAAGYDAAIKLRKGEKEADANSVMQVMMLAATCGTELEVIAEGPDAEKAVREISELLESNFEEAYKK